LTAVNYRETCKVRLKQEVISKLGIVEEVTEEVSFWIEIIIELDLVKKELVSELYKEANEILVIIIASKISARKNLKSAIENFFFLDIFIGSVSIIWHMSTFFFL
jgi:hypothetical protein